MAADSELTIVSVYPDLLGTYGDSGNALVLGSRARRRGIPARHIPVPAGTPIPVTGDIYCLGGGEDANQVLAGELARADGALARAVGREAVVLGVCAGLQLLGRSFTDTWGHRQNGLEVLDMVCGRLERRAVGEIVVWPTAVSRLPVLSGYENHRGDAVLGPGVQALGEVWAGIGNGPAPAGPAPGCDGAVSGQVFATYLHGPVLARNPALADHLLTAVAGELGPLDDSVVDRLHAERVRAGLSQRRSDWWDPSSRVNPAWSILPATTHGPRPPTARDHQTKGRLR